MIGYLFSHPHVFWLALGGILLAIEMLGTGGYLLWSGIAAVITGILAWLVPISWEIQGTSFALLTLIAAFVWWRWLNGRKNSAKPEILNQRGQQLIGRRFTLDTPLVNGRGNLRVADSSWPVIADTNLAAGTEVIVVAVEGITLRIQSF